MTTDEVIARLRGAIAREKSQKAWADANGVSPSYVSDVLQRRRDPGAMILTALGLESFTVYRKANSSEESRAA